MYIVIENKEKYTDQFLIVLKNQMFIFGMGYLAANKKRLVPIDNYLNSIYTWKRKLYSYNIIVAGLKNIVFKRTQKRIIIYINDVVKLPLNNKIRLQTLCKLIDNGNLELSPLPVFKKTFEWVINDIDEIYSNYENGFIF